MMKMKRMEKVDLSLFDNVKNRMNDQSLSFLEEKRDIVII